MLFKDSNPHPVRAEPVEALLCTGRHFDKLSANGMGFVFGVLVFPIILSLSKDVLSRFNKPRMHGDFDKLSANGMGYVFGVLLFPIILSLSKDRLSANGNFSVFEILKS